MLYIPIDVGIDYRLINMQSIVSRIKVIFTCEWKSIKSLFDIVKREIPREWENKQYYMLSVCWTIMYGVIILET